jgi:hypothetical protein
MYYRMAKPLPITLGKAQGEPTRASYATHPTYWARARPFHDIKVWSGRFNALLKNSSSTDTFWSILQVLWLSLKDYVI